MKKRFINSFILFLFFLPGKLLAQQADITGLWKGQIYVDSTKMFLPYEIAISEEKGKLTGYSRIIFFESGKEEPGYQEISIKWKDGKVYIEDEGFFEHQFSFNPPKQIRKLMILDFIEKDTVMIMKGTWSTNRTKRFLSATGTAEVVRKKDFKETALYKKLDTLKLAPKLTFTYTEKKPEPVIAAIVPEKKKEDPDVAPEVQDDAPVLKAIDKLTGLTVVSFVKKRQPPVIRVTPPAKDKQTFYASFAKPGIKYTPPVTPPPPVVSKPQVVTAAVTPPPAKPEKKVEPAPKTPPAPVVVAEKKPVETVVQPAPKPAPPPVAIVAPSVTQGAAELDKRITKTDQAFYFESDSLVLTLYDNGEVDGDTVTVVMNGNIIFSKQGLTTRANSKTIYTRDIPGDSVSLVMYAENLGEIPPNTGLMILMDGEKRYEIRFSADLKTNAAIILRRRKDK